MDYSKARMVRKVYEGRQDTGWLVKEVFQCEIDEIAVVTNLCFHNKDTSGNFEVRIGVKSGGAYFVFQGQAVVGGGVYESLVNPMYLRETDILQVEAKASEDDVVWLISAEIHVFLIEHTKT